MYCSTCGAKLDEGDRFCSKCGASVNSQGFIAADANPTFTNDTDEKARNDEWLELKKVEEVPDCLKKLIYLWLIQDKTDEEREEYFSNIVKEIEAENANNVSYGLEVIKKVYPLLYNLNPQYLDHLYDSVKNKSIYSDTDNTNSYQEVFNNITHTKKVRTKVLRNDRSMIVLAIGIIISLVSFIASMTEISQLEYIGVFGIDGGSVDFVILVTALFVCGIVGIALKLIAEEFPSLNLFKSYSSSAVLMVIGFVGLALLSSEAQGIVALAISLFSLVAIIFADIIPLNSCITLLYSGVMWFFLGHDNDQKGLLYFIGLIFIIEAVIILTKNLLPAFSNKS